MKHYFLTLDFKIILYLLSCIMIGLALSFTLPSDERTYKRGRRGVRRDTHVDYYVTNTIAGK